MPFHVHALDPRRGWTFAKVVEKRQEIVLGALRVHPHGAVGLVSDRPGELKRDRSSPHEEPKPDSLNPAADQRDDSGGGARAHGS